MGKMGRGATIRGQGTAVDKEEATRDRGQETGRTGNWENREQEVGGGGHRKCERR